jgi:hypothetical protein
VILWKTCVPGPGKRLLAVTVFAAICAVVGACSEKLNGGNGCPALCPGQVSSVSDTIFRLDSLSLVFDTTVFSYPDVGEEPALLLSNAPGVQDVRGVVRFDSIGDSISVEYDSGTSSAVDSTKPITGIDTAVLVLQVNPHSVKLGILNDSVVFTVYDVDVPGLDTGTAALAALFTPANLVGTAKFPYDSLSDTLKSDTARIPISPHAVLAHIQNGGDRNLRFGIQVRGAIAGDPVRLWVSNAASGSGPAFFYRARYLNQHEAVDSTTISTNSTTPSSPPGFASQLRSFPLFVVGSPPTRPDVLDIGGLPARRVYLRFHLPSKIVDSSNVIRATLRLKEIPTPQIFPTDSVAVWPTPVTSSAEVSEPAKAAEFVVASSTWSLDSTLTQPADTGLVSLELSGAFRAWHQVIDTVVTRALVLRTLNEGANPVRAAFYSSLAADTSKRPHLEIRYVKQVPLGLP